MPVRRPKRVCFEDADASHRSVATTFMRWLVITNHFAGNKGPGPGGVGRGGGVGRPLGVGIVLGVGVGRTVAVGVAVGVALGVAVGVGVCVGVGVGVG